MTTLNLEYKALSIAKAETYFDLSFFEELAEIQKLAKNKVPKTRTFSFLLMAGGNGEEEIEDILGSYFAEPEGIVGLLGEITVALTRSGFLAKNATAKEKKKAEADIREAIKQTQEQLRSLRNTETSPTSGKKTKKQPSK